MNNETPSDELRMQRLHDLVRVITARDFDATQFYMSIPARPNHDADSVIHWAATIIPELRAEIESLKAERDLLQVKLNDALKEVARLQRR